MPLGSEGSAAARGLNEEAQRDLPATVADLSCAQAAAEARRAVLLMSDGSAVACGANEKLSVTFQRPSLRCDGSAVACSLNEEAQRDLPKMVADPSYTEAAASARHAVLLRSDGSAVACGSNEESHEKAHVTSRCRSPTQAFSPSVSSRATAPIATYSSIASASTLR